MAASRPQRLHPAKFVSDAAVLRHLPSRQEGLTTGETIAVNPQSAHPEPQQAPGRTRILPPSLPARTVEQTRVGASTGRVTFRAHSPLPAKSVTTGDTNSDRDTSARWNSTSKPSTAT